MEKKITNRNYSLIAFFVFHIVVFFIAKFIFNQYFENLNADIASALRIDNHDLYWTIRDKKSVATWLYTFGLLISVSIVSIIYFKTRKNNKKLKGETDDIFNTVMILWFLYVVICLGVLFYQLYYFEGEYGEGTINKDYLLSYLQFIPYLIIGFYKSVIGVSIDLSEHFIQKENDNYENTLSELEKLNKAGLLKEDEFDKKKKEIFEKKILKETELSEEYDLLLSLKNKNILSEKEFEEKKETLIAKNIQKLKNG